MTGPVRKFSVIAGLLVCAACSHFAVAASPPVLLTVDALVNTFDGAARRECSIQDAISSGTHRMSIVFGAVRSNKGEWEGVRSIVRCSKGAADRPATLPSSAAGVPYLIADVTTKPTPRQALVELEVTVRMDKLSGFDEQGRPLYRRDQQERRFTLSPDGSGIIPLVASDARALDVLDVHELYVRIGSRIAGLQAKTYGTVTVAADLPYIDVLLDGGSIGRTNDEGSATLRNIPVGKHEVRIRDYSGRTAAATVDVRKQESAAVKLRVLDLPTPATPLVAVGKNPQGHEEFLRASDTALMVKIPAGEFLMGSAETDRLSSPDERPQRRVHLSAYLIDKTEVTWRQFKRFATATGSKLPPEPLWGTLGDYAVGSILPHEARAYCEWAGGRLPTEAEWEKAARGEDGRIYSWGNDWDPDRCAAEEGAPHRPEPVASFPGCVSPYGVLDLAGSVWEWTSDWYADSYAAQAPRDPKGPSSGSMRVLRGGTWNSWSALLRTANRFKNTLDWRNPQYGFRCAADTPK
jgi:iron(II)-dependent oxidoreductase